MAKHLTKMELMLIKYLHECGQTIQEICRITGRGRDAVRLVVNGNWEKDREAKREYNKVYNARKKLERTVAEPAPAQQEMSLTVNEQQEMPPMGDEQESYRFNARLPIEAKEYLKEMAWRCRMTITDYLIRIVEDDMKAHPDWK